MSTWSAIATAIGSILAVWSITWFIPAIRDNPGERNAEVAARDRVARGEGWDGAAPPRTFSDAELARLAESQEPLTLKQAGVEARQRSKPKRTWLK